MKLLKKILRYQRPHGSITEEAFIRDVLDIVPGMKIDAVGNRLMQVGVSPIMWSCHTDTVHKKNGKQKVYMRKGILRSTGSCLGADDGAGIWLMLNMIKREVPGLYIFHRGEEVGGIGSSHIAENTPHILDHIKFAIALDRKGYSDVITHQFGRCASDEFGDSLAKELGMGFKSDDGGLFTDTANYTDVIGECTNVSVGYFNQHSKSETLDTKFLTILLEALCEVNPDNLVEKRVAGEVDEWDYQRFGGFPNDYTSDYNGIYDHERTHQLLEMVNAYPLACARLLRDYGVRPEEIETEAIEASYLFDRC